MRLAAYVLVGTALTFGTAFAETIAPADVKYEDGAVSMSLTGTAGDPVEGRKIVGSKGLGNCIACHMVTDLVDDSPFHGEIGPELDGLADRYNEAEIRGIVANAKIMFEESMMPSFYKTTGYIRPGDGYTGKAAKGELSSLLSAQQIEDVVAYLLTMKE